MLKTCNICWWIVALYNPTDIYWPKFKHFSDPKEKPWKEICYIYQCNKCKATVWCHEDSKKPFWILANKETKRARHLCHELLDPIWKKEQKWDYKSWSRWKRRKELYWKIAKHMWIPYEKMHFGMFNIEQCRVAYKFILIIKKELWQT